LGKGFPGIRPVSTSSARAALRRYMRGSPLEIIKIFKAEFFFQLTDGLGAAPSHFAMHHYFFIRVDPVRMFRYGRQGDQLGPDIDDIVFMGSARRSAGIFLRSPAWHTILWR